MSGYVAVNTAAIFGAFDHLQRPGAIAFSLVVAAPVIGHIWSFILWMRDSDEFVRMLTAKRFVLATGVTLGLASAWGFLELYGRMPHISPFFVLPLFWAAYGLMIPLIRTTH
jgi:hypothetical protein